MELVRAFVKPWWPPDDEASAEGSSRTNPPTQRPSRRMEWRSAMLNWVVFVTVVLLGIAYAYDEFWWFRH